MVEGILMISERRAGLGKAEVRDRHAAPLPWCLGSSSKLPIQEKTVLGWVLRVRAGTGRPSRFAAMEICAPIRGFDALGHDRV